MNPNNPTQDLPDIRSGQTTNSIHQTESYSDQSDPKQSNQPIGLGYELRDVIGKGGMGIVYRAYDVNMHREVAVKILQDKYAPDSSTATRFIEEAQITGQLQHPGIPAVYQVSQFADGRPFLAMKLIKGDTLETLLKQKTPINVLGVFEAICQAVGYAHAHDVIHRDLKPANIMVGAFGEVQVMDWGLAKVLASGGRQSTAADTDPNATTTGKEIQSLRDTDGSFTQAGSVMGTPAFMPPEQAGGEIDKIGQRADVFGLGAILCNLLTGEPPYSGANAESVRQKALRGKTEDAFAKLDACGAEPDVVALCKQCMAFEPDDRPKNANAIAIIVAKLRTEAEERAKQAELNQAKAEVAAAEQRKRRRLVQVGAAIVAAVLLVGILGTLIGLQQARDARDAESARATSEAEAKREVQRQKEEVDRKREEVVAALKLANERTKNLSDAYGDFVFDIQTQLSSRPGTQELRRALLEKARVGLKKILDDARKMGEPDKTIVWSYIRMGNLDQELGNAKAAEQHYRAGLDIAQQLTESDSTNTEILNSLAGCLERLSWLYLEAKRTDEAASWCQKFHDTCIKLAKLQPSGADAQLAVSYEILGRLNMDQNRPKEALIWYRQANTLAERLAAALPNDTGLQNNFATTLMRLGEVHQVLGQLQDARASFQKGAEITKRLAEADSNHVGRQRSLAISYDRLGAISQQLGQRQDALRWFEKASELFQRTADADPKNTQSQLAAIISYARLGGAARHFHELKTAQNWYEKAVTGCQRLIAANPSHKQVEFEFSQYSDALGDLATELGKPSESMTWYQRGLDARQRLFNSEPKNLLYKRALTISYLKLAITCQVAMDFTKAIPFYEQAEKLSSELVKGSTNLGTPEFDLLRIQRSLTYCRLGANAIADIEFIFQQPAPQIADLLVLRVKALLKREKPTEAIKTAERFAQWVETLQQGRDYQRYNAACVYALCASATPGPDAARLAQEKLIDQSIALLQKAESSGYFTKERITHIKKDTDFDGIRTHPKFVAFIKDLDKPLELAPVPRLKN